MSRYTITLHGEDMKEDVERFVADVIQNRLVNSNDNEEGTIILVDRIEVLYDP